MRRKASVVVEREPNSLFCEGHRAWIVTNERHNAFFEIDGARQKVTQWRCPECRGEAPAGAAQTARGPVTAADISKDERLGPYREVAERVKVNASGKSERVLLKVCGHEACVVTDAKGVRCRVCARDARKAAA